MSKQLSNEVCHYQFYLHKGVTNIQIFHKVNYKVNHLSMCTLIVSVAVDTNRIVNCQQSHLVIRVVKGILRKRKI